MQKGSSLIIGIVIGVVIMIALLGAFLLGKNSQSSSSIITNSPSKISSPAASNNSLDSQMESANKVAVSPSPDPTANWKTFNNSKYKYSVKYPVFLNPEESNDYYHYVKFSVTQTDPNSAPLPTFDISVVKDDFKANDPASVNFLTADWIQKLSNLKVGEAIPMSGESTLKRLPNIIVAGKSAMVIESNTISLNSKQERVYLNSNGYVYMITTSFDNSATSENFQQFLATFKFLN